MSKIWKPSCAGGIWSGRLVMLYKIINQHEAHSMPYHIITKITTRLTKHSHPHNLWQIYIDFLTFVSIHCSHILQCSGIGFLQKSLFRPLYWVIQGGSLGTLPLHTLMSKRLIFLLPFSENLAWFITFLTFQNSLILYQTSSRGRIDRWCR